MRVWYSPLAWWLWNHQDSLKSDEQFYEAFLKPGATVIDCGAHIGTLAMTAADIVGANGKVIACEMHPRTFSYLARNVSDNKYKNVTPIHTAIGDVVGTVSITDEYVSDINHITETKGVLSVPMTTIDSLAKDLPTIDLIKLDVEGYELQALRGAKETLTRTHAVYVEAAPRNFARYGYTLRDILILLQKASFTCYAFTEKGDTYVINENYTPTVKYENILALKNSTA